MSEINDELDYLEFRNAKEIGRTGVQIVAYFGAARAAELQLRWNADFVAGRIGGGNVEPCSDCARKHYPVCPSITRDEWHRTLR